MLDFQRLLEFLYDIKFNFWDINKYFLASSQHKHNQVSDVEFFFGRPLMFSRDVESHMNSTDVYRAEARLNMQ